MPQIVDEVLSACQAATTELGAVLGRALDASVTVTVGQPRTLQTNALPGETGGPGLAVVMFVGSTGALLLLGQSTGLLQPWCEAPDASQQSKLATLGQESAVLLLPPPLAADKVETGWVKNLAGALARGGVAEGAAIIPLEISLSGACRGPANLIWPVPKPSLVFEGPASGLPAGNALGGRGSGPAGVSCGSPQPPPPSRLVSDHDLPPYTRSLLRVKVPVVVTLAEKKQSLGRIVELSPGAIIQFDKSCEEMLELRVGDRPIACGEAVKVGDKFGLRLISMVRPQEHFHSLKPNPRA
ncbi:MAG: FliM/FliN family flagellar motor C-terminal domain-containing protein [Thermoguttaceae bacterium]